MWTRPAALLVLAACAIAYGCMRRDGKAGEPVGVSTVTSTPVTREVLPSWRPGAAKQAILDAIASMTRPPDAIPEEDRVAVFEIDGTLWPERPTAEALFTVARLKANIVWTPGLSSQEPFKSILAEDVDRLALMDSAFIASAIARTHSGITDDAFELAARGFLSDTKHPVLGSPYPKLAYVPMRELIMYLRDRRFTIYLATTADQTFARAIASAIYDIPRENVIGTKFGMSVVTEDGGQALRRTDEIVSFNDREEKVSNLQRHVGRRPVVAAGRVGNGGDIPMLTSARAGRPSLAVVIHHDDASRELAYDEPGDPTLTAARERGFVVVSMRLDWATVFDQPVASRPTPR